MYELLRKCNSLHSCEDCRYEYIGDSPCNLERMMKHNKVSLRILINHHYKDIFSKSKLEDWIFRTLQDKVDYSE